MSWRAPTIDDLASTLSKRELDAYRTSTDVEAADPVAALIDSTAEMVRSYCRSNKACTLSPNAGEIPESLISPAMDYAAYSLLKRFPTPVGEDRRRAREQAVALFLKVSTNEFTPESYGAVEDSATEGNIPHMTVPTHVLD